MSTRIKKGDLVMVVAGNKDERGKTGRVIEVLAKDDKVVVEGVRRITKNVKKTQQNPQGGQVQVEVPIHLSNVMPVDPQTGKRTRVRIETRDGVKHRVAKSGASLGTIGKKA